MKKPFASIYVSYCQRIDLLEIEYGINDYMVFVWAAVNAEGITLTSTVRRSIIRHNAAGDTYIISEGRRWYTKDAIRI